MRSPRMLRYVEQLDRNLGVDICTAERSENRLCIALHVSMIDNPRAADHRLAVEKDILCGVRDYFASMTWNVLIKSADFFINILNEVTIAQIMSAVYF